MKCNACNSLMLLERTEESTAATSQLYTCPLCAHTRLYAQPKPPADAISRNTSTSVGAPANANGLTESAASLATDQVNEGITPMPRVSGNTSVARANIGPDDEHADFALFDADWLDPYAPVPG